MGPPAGGYHYGRIPMRRFNYYNYRHRFFGLPGWHTYGYSYGLPPVLLGMPNLAFLNDGLLVGSYIANGMTVYVYVIDQNGIPIECRVDSYGNVLSMSPL